MSNQTIEDRKLLRQYCEKQKEEKAARGIKPSEKDIKNKAANERLLVMFRIGLNNEKNR